MAGFAPCGRGSLAPRRGPCIGLAIREFGFPRGSLVLLSGGHLMRASSQRWPPLNKTPSLLRGRLPDSQVFAESEAPRNCQYNPLIIKHIHNFELCSYGLCMAKRVLKMAIRCLLFDRWMSTMQLQSSVCQRIGNTVSFFCQHRLLADLGPEYVILVQTCHLSVEVSSIKSNF